MPAAGGPAGRFRPVLSRGRPGRQEAGRPRGVGGIDRRQQRGGRFDLHGSGRPLAMFARDCRACSTCPALEAPRATVSRRRKPAHSLGLLDDSVDALSDALVAESVHQAVQGNPLRTASTLDAVASGEAPPPELDVVRTPRTGSALTYRMVVLFAGPPAAPAGWLAPAVPVRAEAEPHLNAWTGRLLGNPANVRCVVERLDPATGAVLEAKELRLNRRACRRSTVSTPVGSTEAGPPGRRRILYAMVRACVASPRRDPPSERRSPGGDPSLTSATGVRELVRRTPANYRRARSTRAAEPARANQPAGVNLAELQAGGEKAERASACSRPTRPAGRPACRPRTMRGDPARPLRSRGVPLSARQPADRHLVLQASSITQEVAEQVGGPRREGCAHRPSRRAARAVPRLRAVLSDSFVVLPTFSAGNAASWRKRSPTHEDSGERRPGSRHLVPRASRPTGWPSTPRCGTRSPQRRALDLRNGPAATPRSELREANAGWDCPQAEAGLPVALLPGDQSAPAIDVKRPLAGLLIDEWVEVVPNPIETTGLASSSTSRGAPAEHLAAVPPDPDQP